MMPETPYERWEEAMSLLMTLRHDYDRLAMQNERRGWMLRAILPMLPDDKAREVVALMEWS
jgi:hypothetical protein